MTGKIVKQELEQESGDSGLRYSFAIQSANVMHKVGVDAATGKVLGNVVEGAETIESDAQGDPGDSRARAAFALLPVMDCRGRAVHPCVLRPLT